MTTEKTIWQVRTGTADATEQLGRQIGARLRGGEVIELSSDLGGGKTTFVRGLTAGLGSTDQVSSPSFTISQIYQAPTSTIHHYDFYRLAEPGLMAQELSEVLSDPKAIVVVEWAGVVENVLPEERVRIVIAADSENGRQLTIELPGRFSYLRGEA